MERSRGVSKQLAAGVAHEVGTPLNVIEMRAEQILQDLEDSKERRRRNVTIIIAQVDGSGTGEANWISKTSLLDPFTVKPSRLK